MWAVTQICPLAATRHCPLAATTRGGDRSWKCRESGGSALPGCLPGRSIVWYRARKSDIAYRTAEPPDDLRCPPLRPGCSTACTRSSVGAASVGHVVVGLNAERRPTVDHAEDGSASAGFGHDHFDGVGGRGEDSTDLGNLLHLVEHVHRETFSHEHQEGVTSPMASTLRVANSTSSSSFPERRTRRGPEDSQKARPNRRCAEDPTRPRAGLRRS